MIITSDADFATEGWTGDGSPGNPYTIEWLEFTSSIDDACISISNTAAHFRIVNCFFNPSNFAYAIKLNSTSNGQIEYSTTGSNIFGISIFFSYYIALSHLTLDSTCVVMELSSDSNVSYCNIDSAPGDGVYLWDCSDITVQGCEITSCSATGIALETTSGTTISENIVEGNFLEQIYIYGFSTGNRIFNNEIHTGLTGVRDNGIDNTWDNGVSIGNWWSDYGGTGPYIITGTAGSIDHYPRGLSSTEPTIYPTLPTTSTTTTGTTTASPTPGAGELLITNFAPLNLTTRVVLVLSIGMLYGGLVVLVIKRLR